MDTIRLPIDDLPSPTPVRRRFDELVGLRRSVLREHADRSERLKAIAEYLGIADAVESALDKLSEQLFGAVTKTIEENLTIALQEVLEQPICLRAERDFKRGGATMDFHVLRDGQREDILRGTGGSVANILSVGLRLFALVTLDKKEHRRFLVLDEQDCWLRPDLVPRLVKIVQRAGKELGFQVVMISHHEIGSFRAYADRIYQFEPTADGVAARVICEGPQTADGDDKACERG
jgi:hypothetical protein